MLKEQTAQSFELFAAGNSSLATKAAKIRYGTETAFSQIPPNITSTQARVSLADVVHPDAYFIQHDGKRAGELSRAQEAR